MSSGRVALDHTFFIKEGRREAFLEVAAYCDRHAIDTGGGILELDGPAWVNAMRDVAQHCRMLAEAGT